MVSPYSKNSSTVKEQDGEEENKEGVEDQGRQSPKKKVKSKAKQDLTKEDYTFSAWMYDGVKATVPYHQDLGQDPQIDLDEAPTIEIMYVDQVKGTYRERHGMLLLRRPGENPPNVKRSKKEIPSYNQRPWSKDANWNAEIRKRCEEIFQNYQESLGLDECAAEA